MTDDFARSWRDLADELTAAQAAGLDALQRHAPATERTADALLGLARHHAAQNLAALFGAGLDEQLR